MQIELFFDSVARTFLTMRYNTTVQYLILPAFGIHVTLGALCVLSMPHAAAMPPPDASHEAMEMHRTPASADEDPMPDAGRPSCAGGHCISPLASLHGGGTAHPVQEPPVPSATTTPFRYAVFDRTTRPFSHAPPPVPLSTRTVVLRC